MRLFWLLALVTIACSFSGQAISRSEPTGTPEPVTATPTFILRSSVTPELSEVLDDFALQSAYTRCVTASNALWLRSKPWAKSAAVIPNALLAGTLVQVYPNPYGETTWMEVWVPSETVTGYVNSNYIGECK